MQDKLTILVNSCDAYSDVWDLFFASLKVQWSQCPYKMVLNTEKKTYSYKDMPISVHNYSRSFGRKDRWGERYRATLRDMDTPYVLPILDDFVLTEPVKNPELIEEIITFMDANPNVTVVYLDAFPKWCFTLEESAELKQFGKMPQVCSYKLSTAIAVWRREKLLTLIRDFETPWEWEMNASFRACRMQCGDFYAVVDALEDIPRNIMFSVQHGGAIRRGLWNVGTDELARNYGVELDLSKRDLMDVDNPYRETVLEPYSLKKNFTRDWFKGFFWRNVVSHAKIKYKNFYEKYRFHKSIW